MKKILISKYISTLLFVGCKKNNSPAGADAVLTRPDLALCPCCGGTFIQIKDITYRIENLPADLNGPFPIDVVLTYKKRPDRFGWYIKSDDIRRS